MQKIQERFAGRSFDSIGPDEIYHFLESITEGQAKSTRRLRFAQFKALYNFPIEKADLNMRNPCDDPILAKGFKAPKQVARRILDRETVEELIYNAENLRDRLILELQARCGLRIGEVLNLIVSDVSGRKLLIQEPKSGKDAEIAFMPEHIATRLAEYITAKQLLPNDRVFHLCYTSVRNLVTGLGKKLNVKISPHDLRRHSATYASRNGVPLEIISKVILRHQDLKTTQIYLGKISDTEAIRWMDILHGR